MLFRNRLLVLLLSTAPLGLHGQAYAPSCTARMLDVRALLPPETLDRATARLLVLDVRNRGKEPCELRAFIVHLPTEDGFNFRFGGGRDRSATAKAFADSKSRIAPGAEVHEVMAWSSVPQTREDLDYDDCLATDGLTVAMDYGRVVLDVQHLWREQCGQAWLSSLRAGAFVPGEELSAEWLARYGLRRGDVSEPLLSSNEKTTLRSFDSIQYLKSSFESGYSGWFVLWLERPAEADGCPFRTLRRREADGYTTVVVNHCPQAREKPSDAPGRFFEIMLRDYKLLPERVGSVDYETSSEIVEDRRQVAVLGHATVEVRDPTDPMLPAIETAFVPCRAEQLALDSVQKLGGKVDVRSVPPMGDVPRAGRAYTFRNVSQATCLVGGTPDLTVPVLPESQHRSIGLGTCRDCSDGLFKARGQHWITMRPAQSAHFIVTGKPVYGADHRPCAFFPKLGLALPAGTTQLNYGLASCGQVDVSAWRDGVYDDDPLNLRYSVAKREGSGQEDLAKLPDACAKEVTPQSGIPYMFASSGSVQFGLSSQPSAFRDNAPLAIWVSNPTDKEVGVMSCLDLEGFFIGGFDVLDQSGNRVLAKEEMKEKNGDGRKGMPGPTRELMSCTRNFAIPIPPHSCVHGDFDRPGYDFVKDLGTLYTLPAGSYQIVPRIKEGETRIQTTGLAVEVTP